MAQAMSPVHETKVYDALRPLLNDLESKNAVINRLLQDIEEKGGEIEKLKVKAKTREEEVMVQVGDVTVREMMEMPKEVLVQRVVEVQQAAFTNYNIAEEAKRRLRELSTSITNLSERQGSISVLKQALRDQSDRTLDLQTSLKAHQSKHSKLRTLATTQQQVIKKLETSIHTHETKTTHLFSSLSRLRDVINEDCHEEKYNRLAKDADSLAKYINMLIIDCEDKGRRSDSVAVPVHTRAHELEAAQTRISIMEEAALGRERQAAQEIASLKMQLAEARALSMSAKPPTPTPLPAKTDPSPKRRSATSLTTSTRKKLDPIVPRHRFE
eukprot:TRINITY_DN8953_c0_g1_i1.p1 TRINITY_DN8953_c0_g1~~TRINITY_DN8953_c0_g1_i1.p1  ORF type:complete len:327 (+),score=63.10 TRINITY_DN8953_c0_g1_i1:405-1385(+)